MERSAKACGVFRTSAGHSMAAGGPAGIERPSAPRGPPHRTSILCLCHYLIDRGSLCNRCTPLGPVRLGCSRPAPGIRRAVATRTTLARLQAKAVGHSLAGPVATSTGRCVAPIRRYAAGRASLGPEPARLASRRCGCLQSVSLRRPGVANAPSMSYGSCRTMVPS